jgi:hypothetical protein
MKKEFDSMDSLLSDSGQSPNIQTVEEQMNPVVLNAVANHQLHHHRQPSK